MAEPGAHGRAEKKLAIAFYCWVKGYFKKSTMQALGEIPAATCESEKEGIPIAMDDHGEMGLRVDRRDLPGYLTDDFLGALKLWRDWKEFGFADSGGTNNQGSLYMDVLRYFQECARGMGIND